MRRLADATYGLVLLYLCGVIGCQLLFFLPELKDGKHYPQPVTAAVIQRGVNLAACLQGWARVNGYPNADYSGLDLEHHLAIVGVGDPGVAGPTDFVAARESGDTLYIDQRIVTDNGAEYVALQYHELLHVVQQSHNELIGKNGDIHWAPPWDACHVIRYLIL